MIQKPSLTVIQKFTCRKIRYKNKKTIHISFMNWSSAICICSAMSESSLSLRVVMRLSHDTSTPFPASHSLRTSIAMSSGSPWNLFLIIVILFPMSSWRRNVPKTLILGATLEGSLIFRSCRRVGFCEETVENVLTK